ncbi:hypothetical protein BJX70DRAFT_214158 [Aspergillus crustosus]
MSFHRNLWLLLLTWCPVHPSAAMTVPPPTSAVRTVHASTSSDQISKIIATDGAVIVRQFIPPETVQSLNQEVDPYLDATITGPQANTGDMYKKTVGSRTKHMGNLAAVSPTYRSTILNHPLMHMSIWPGTL